MVSDLVVKQGSTVLLNDNPADNLKRSFEKLRIDSLQDLVSHGIIGSQDTLEKLLSAAKDVTESTLSKRETFFPFVTVHGTRRPDLRRFGSFTAALPDVRSTEIHSFWRAVRTIDPQRLERVTPTMGLNDLLPGESMTISRFLFNDITVEPNSTLTVAASVESLNCQNLLIQRAGRILVEGSGVLINAFSIEGIQ